jgi:hypothetical protein
VNDIIERLQNEYPIVPPYVKALCHEAADEIQRLRAENATLRADAERYRWLCKNITFHDIDHDYDTEGHNVPVLAQVSNRLWYHATDDVVSNTLDSAIDAAMAGQPKWAYQDREQTKN